MFEIRLVNRQVPVAFDEKFQVTTCKTVQVLQFREAILDPLTFVAGNRISNWTEWKDVPVVDEG